MTLGNIGPAGDHLQRPGARLALRGALVPRGLQGIVFLTGDWRDMQPVLTQIDQVQAEDEEHAAELAEIMARPARPPFVTIAKTG